MVPATVAPAALLLREGHASGQEEGTEHERHHAALAARASDALDEYEEEVHGRAPF
jgi:flagellar biosynthesis/type III secretory pathway protein FliH